VTDGQTLYTAVIALVDINQSINQCVYL